MNTQLSRDGLFKKLSFPQGSIILQFLVVKFCISSELFILSDSFCFLRSSILFWVSGFIFFSHVTECFSILLILLYWNNWKKQSSKKYTDSWVFSAVFLILKSLFFPLCYDTQTELKPMSAREGWQNRKVERKDYVVTPF